MAGSTGPADRTMGIVDISENVAANGARKKSATELLSTVVKNWKL
jgi:hypothetical protein